MILGIIIDFNVQIYTVYLRIKIVNLQPKNQIISGTNKVNVKSAAMSVLQSLLGSHVYFLYWKTRADSQKTRFQVCLSLGAYTRFSDPDTPISVGKTRTCAPYEMSAFRWPNYLKTLQTIFECSFYVLLCQFTINCQHFQIINKHPTTVERFYNPILISMIDIIIAIIDVVLKTQSL